MNKYFIMLSERDRNSQILLSDKETEEEVIRDFVGQLIAQDYEMDDEEIPSNWNDEFIDDFYMLYDVLLSSIYNCQTFQKVW